jgi:hypothetical protein
MDRILERNNFNKIRPKVPKRAPLKMAAMSWALLGDAVG